MFLLRVLFLQLAYKLTRPTPAWGPADPANRTGKYAPDKQPLVVETSAWSAGDDAATAGDDTADDVKPPYYSENNSNASTKDSGVANPGFAKEGDDANGTVSGQEMRDLSRNANDSDVAAF